MTPKRQLTMKVSSLNVGHSRIQHKAGSGLFLTIHDLRRQQGISHPLDTYPDNLNYIPARVLEISKTHILEYRSDVPMFILHCFDVGSTSRVTWVY